VRVEAGGDEPLDEILGLEVRSAMESAITGLTWSTARAARIRATTNGTATLLLPRVQQGEPCREMSVPRARVESRQVLNFEVWTRP